MGDDRIDAALSRIRDASARIDAAAQRLRAKAAETVPGNGEAPSRTAVAAALAELDALLEALQR